MSHFLATQYNVIGIIGVIMVLIAYLLLQIDRLSQDSITYSFLNLVGSGLILVSLYFEWNLSAGVIEIAWMAISFYGLGKAFYLYRKQ